MGLITTTTCLIVSPANAFTTYFGSQSGTIPAFELFKTDAGSSLAGPEDFEGFAGVDNPNNPAIQRNVTVDIGGIQTTIGAPSSTFGGILDTNYNSSYNTTQPSPPATNYYLGGVNPGGTENFRIKMAEPVSGIGFFATDIGDFNATLEVKGFLGGVQIASFQPVLDKVDGNVAFLGAIGATGQTFDEVQLDIVLDAGQVVSGDSFGIDDIYLVPAGSVIPPQPPGQSTPEPGTLVGLALLGTAGFVSRRKNK